MLKSFKLLTSCSSCLRGKLLVSFICVSAVILFNTAYSENSTTLYFNFLSLPTAPPIQQQPPPIEKTEIPAIIDFPGGRLIGSVEPVESVSQPSAISHQPSAIRITAPVAFVLKRNNQTNGQTDQSDQSDQSDQQTNFINPVEDNLQSSNPVNPVKSLLRFTINSSTHNSQLTTLFHRYPELGKPVALTLSPGDNIEIELVAQQNIVYLQIPFGEILEITNIEFLENTQLTANCNCKQVEEIDLSLLYNSFKH